MSDRAYNIRSFKISFSKCPHAPKATSPCQSRGGKPHDVQDSLAIGALSEKRDL